MAAGLSQEGWGHLVQANRPALDPAWRSLKLPHKHNHSLLVTLTEPLLSARLTLSALHEARPLSAHQPREVGACDYLLFATEEMETWKG